MSHTDSPTPSGSWTSTQAYLLSVVCLVVGIAGGWFVRGSQSPATVTALAATAPASSAAPPTPEQMRHMADKQAEPLLSQLKSDPSNPALLASVGNIYYDTQQFPIAIEYYQHNKRAKIDHRAALKPLLTSP